MHIIVCVKMVPDTTLVQIDPETNTLIREGVPFITNPYDSHALEEAVRLKDRYGGRVTAISMGPPSAELILRKALAIGADDAVLLSDRAFGGADTLATSKVLAEAIHRLSEDDPVCLVFCGMQTIDGDTAQVGPGIARRLNYSQLTLVDRILDVDSNAGSIRVRRKLERHYEIIEARLPALITVVKEINRPRYPTVPARLRAQSALLPIWTNDVMKLNREEIGLLGSPTQVRRIFAPEREAGEILNASGSEQDAALERVIAKLYEWDAIQRD